MHKKKPQKPQKLLPVPKKQPQTPREAVAMTCDWLSRELLKDMPYGTWWALEQQHPEILRAEQAMNAAVLATNSTVRTMAMAKRWMQAWQRAVQAHRDPQARQIALGLGQQAPQATAPDIVDMADSMQFTKQFLAKPVAQGRGVAA